MPIVERKDRFRELILYISQKCADDPTFGATKLNKILYFSDFLYYAYYGEAITGVEYQKLPNGPAPRKLLPVRNRMIKRGELGIQEVPLRRGNVQHRTVNLRAPRLNVFTPEQISLIDDVIELLGTADADGVSRLSHRMEGWIVAKDGETIPYSTVFVSAEPLNEVDVFRGQQLAREFGLVSEKA